MVMSAARPPLAAMMTATRCNASRVVASPTGLASQRAARPVSPAGSRVRAISAASRLGVAVVSSQLTPGRITSAQISDSSPVVTTRPSQAVAGGIAAARHRTGNALQSARPSWPAPLACHRCCQVAPGWAWSQSSTMPIPRRRFSSPARPATANGAAASSPSRSARASRVRGQASRSGRGGNRRRSASAWASGGPLPGRGGAAAVSGPGPALTTGPARTAHSATRPGSPQRPAAMGWPAARRAADERPARRR